MTKKSKRFFSKGLVAMAVASMVIASAATLKADATEGVYNGITVGDGDYSDWETVVKHDGAYGIDKMAMVWDGYYVYLYFEWFGYDYGNGTHGSNWNEITWSGPKHTGNYSIKTEYGEMIVHFGNVGGEPYVEINGKDGKSVGAEVYVNNKDWISYSHIWEVKIPTEILPNYVDTISLCYYQGDVLISDVANLNMPDDLANEGIKDEVVFDGEYLDWTQYPHTTIDYSTNGTHSSIIDANGALYCDGTTLYGYVQTAHPSHTSGEDAVAFTKAVTIKLNGKHLFYPRVASVNEAGLINWNPNLSKLAPGEYRFKVFDTAGWGNAKSIYNLDQHNVCYGDLIVTIGSDGRNQCEYALDTVKLAEKFGLDASDIKTYEAQYGRLGQQWIGCAGASTSPWISCVILLGIAGCGVFLSRKYL